MKTILLVLMFMLTFTTMSFADTTLSTTLSAASAAAVASANATTQPPTAVLDSAHLEAAGLAPETPPKLGWGPSAIANVTAFYLNGNYKLLQGGFGAGAAYTFSQSGNINSVGLYLGPQSEQSNGTTTTSLNALLYVDLFKTSVGQFGLGLGTEFWKSGDGLQAPNRNTTFLAFAYKF